MDAMDSRVQTVYQEFLDQTNELYEQLKADKITLSLFTLQYAFLERKKEGKLSLLAALAAPATL